MGMSQLRQGPVPLRPGPQKFRVSVASSTITATITFFRPNIYLDEALNMLSQSETAKLLEHCVSEDLPELAMEEVLSAYIAW